MTVADAAVSVVLAADSFATAAPCVEALRRQTIAAKLELVLVGPQLEVPEEAVRGFGDVRVIGSAIPPLVVARARGILAATAPCVFVAETHALPEPRCLEIVAEEVAGGAGAVIPRFRNANPKTAGSWASLFATYGSFTGESAFEPAAVPLHNGGFRREVIQRVAKGRPDDLTYGLGLTRTLRDEGLRMAYAPAAAVRHLNVARPRAMVKDRFISARLWAGLRARRWSAGRRALHVASTPFVPALFLGRVLRSDGWRTHRSELPRGTLVLLAALMGPIAVGELLGYVAGPADMADRTVPLELNRSAYA